MKIAEIFEAFDRYAFHNLANPKDSEVEKVDGVKKLADTIRANCKTMLEAYQKTGLVLYRGLSGASDEVVITGIRPDRKSVQMDDEAHDDINAYLRDKGFKVTRGNSIFVSARPGTAKDWGRTYAVFVKDGWTAQVYDKKKDGYSFFKMRDIGGALVELKWSSDDFATKELKKFVDKKFRSLGPREFTSSADLAEVLKKKYYEALIVGDSYIAVRIEAKGEFPSLWTELKKELNIGIES